MSIYLGKRLAQLIRSKVSSGDSANDDAETPAERCEKSEEPIGSGDYEAGSIPTEPEQKSSEETRHLHALELETYESFEDIQGAYRRLSREYHPDFFSGQPEQEEMATEVQGRINEAYRYFSEKLKTNKA